MATGGGVETVVDVSCPLISSALILYRYTLAHTHTHTHTHIPAMLGTLHTC
jgi:hypothetical protein